MQSFEQFEINRWEECIERNLGTSEPNYSFLRNLCMVGILYRVIEEDGENVCVIANNWSETKRAIEQQAH